jgi:PAS domain S-box-containing protein
MGKPLQVLMIEDSDDDVLLIIQTLKNGGYDPVYARVKTARAMGNALKDKQWDIILCDYKLAKFSGLKAIALVKKRQIDIPLIMVSGAIGEEKAAECIRSGVRDFIRKDNLSSLVPTIKRELTELKSRIERRRAGQAVLAGKVALFNDISKRKRVKAEIVRLNEDLQKRVTEQAAQLEAMSNQRIQAQKALTESEEKFSNFMEDAPIGICITDLSGHVQSINRKIEEKTGWTREELLNRDGLAIGFFDEETKRTLLARLAARLREDVPRTTEIPVTRKDGSRLWINLKTTILRKDGLPNGLLLAFIDVTDRREAQQKVLESEEKYRLLVENSSEVILVAQEGVFKFVNRASLKMYDSSYEKMTSTPFIEFVHPGDRDLVMSYYLRRLRGEAVPSHYSFRVVTPAGIVRWAEIRVTVVTWEGKPATLSFITDITRRKQAEGKLKESEERFSSLFDHSRDCVYIIDLAGNFIDANQSALNLLGYDRADIPSLNIISLLYETDMAIGLQDFEEIVRTGFQNFISDYTLKCKNGKLVHVETQASLVYKEGKPHSILGIARDTTERKQAEENLQKSEEKYRGILNSIEEGYYEADLNGNFTFFNDSLSRIWGYTREEMLDLGYRKYLDQENVKKILDVFDKVSATGTSARYNYQLVRKDGGRRYIEASISLIKDSANRPAGFRGIVHDVTEHREMEEAIRQSEEKHRTIIEQMSDGYFEVDLRGHFTFVNDAQCASLGYSREEMLGLHNRQYIAKERRREWYELFGKIHVTGIPVKSHDLELVKRDGTRAYHAISASLIRNTEGKPVGFRGISRDVTERKAAEIQLRSYADEISDLYNHAPCGYHSISADGSFLRINDTELEWLGYDRDEIIGRKKWGDLLTAESLSHFQKIFPIFQKQGRMNDLEFDVIRKDGSVFPVLVNARVIKDKEGHYLQSSSNVFDITQLKKAQSELRTKNSELTMAYEDLRQKQAMILQQEKMASIGMLAAGVAHEIKNPLAIILQGMNYLQSAVGQDSLVIEVIERLNKAVLRADTIVKGLLSYARQTPVALVEQDIRALLDESLVLTEHEFHAKNINLIKEYPPELPRISVDGNQMKQVFVNLIINGIEAMSPRGKFTISIQQVKDVAGKNVLQLSFTDTGYGISADKIKKVFDPFYTTKVIGNTGLGLSVSKGIIDMHGGIIYAESEEGKGTSIIIKLPTP